MELIFRLSRAKIHGKTRVWKSQKAEEIYSSERQYIITREVCHKRNETLPNGMPIRLIMFPKGWVIERVTPTRKLGTPQSRIGWAPTLGLAKIYAQVAEDLWEN